MQCAPTCITQAFFSSAPSSFHCALSSFTTEECLQLFRLLDRLRDSLGRIASAEED